ncbi:DNA topoisomerase 2, putative [Toxoplasma gondii ME49]|uniref:DNA topoisomerase 2 n=2 Tax=Toxoplasma gondii TaxID=5811 RepID=A0A125YJP9_TOXGV|nr:DNA topoisomerase 2, putative [Toxoplasma gondii ME49]EPT26031.1 DNA topoisomerase 2, putative [Toxoplasma gondii ME49]ESS35056.1 putative DNA topoisomerase 2 [Toxoplasma gondii VEG]|eukprot:XP_018635491.1 DNA topoisomerase 2, putative [Toxoplasma gondii ME49]
MSSSEDEEFQNSSPSLSPAHSRPEKGKKSGGGKPKTIEQRYQKKSQLEHILLRPDTYIGSTEVHTQALWVMEEGQETMVYKTINYVPGLYKIVDEILVNAADVKAREGEEQKGKPLKPGARRMSAIKIDINKASGRITIWNDGEGIPVAIHQEHKVYVPEMIFGQLLTSDNYDDSECRVTGGRNGYGAKLTNIFSREFTVECADGERKKKFKMTWTKNMEQKSESEISSYNGTDYVKISFIPDFAKFGMTGFDDDSLSLLRKRAYDLAGTSGVKVFLNGTRIDINSFSQYVDLYLGGRKSEKPSKEKEEFDESDDDWDEGPKRKKAAKKNGKKGELEDEEDVANGVEKKVIKIHDKQWRWEVVISSTDGGQFQQVSFVNSICTTKGGTHVSHVIEPLLAAIVKKANTKNKGGMEIKAAHVKQHLWIFVSCLIVNPAFDSQTKETLTTKPAKFGSKCTLADKTIGQVVKSSIVENVVLWAQTKQQVELRKQMKVGKTKGRERLAGIPKLEDANDAGGRHSQDCTLILTEGDSAKTSCLAGLSVVGRDRYGVFPLRGKLLNVRDASFKQLTENKEIQNILKIVGLQVNDRTEDTRGLRYGSVMIMTDQDHDGSHIKGLLINMMHHYWPQLLKCRGFLKAFSTPIVKVSKNNVEKAFYTIPEYEQWKRSCNTTGWKIKYYKGLGTSTDREFKEYFNDLDKHQIDFVWSGQHDGELIDMAFNKKRAEDRKRWLQSYQEGTFVDHNASSLSYSDFVNKELILFSRYDTERSIPQLVDGWKPGQRKVLFACIKKNMKHELKVAQLAGYVSEVSAYHHGEASLQQTIVTMAQRFVGSNNLNFLEPVGQFGSRKEGGKDASAARYIFTRLAFYTRLVFHEADDPILEYEYEEGQRIEPKMYVPVIPTVLINGSEGIGTGWSSFVPNYNPRDVIENLRRYIDGEEMQRMTPWYRGFRGRIEENAAGTGFETIGLVRRCGEDTYEITELPIKRWTQDYKEWLEENLPTAEKRDTLIADYRDCSSHEEIHFTVKVGEERVERPEREGLEKYFKLKSSLSITNLTLFDPHGRVQRYANELEIIKEFAPIRLEFYHRRKAYCLAMLEKARRILSNRLRFILAVVNGELIINNKRKKALIEELFSQGYDPMKEIEDAANAGIRAALKRDVTVDDEALAEGGEEEEEIVAGCTAKHYDYLLGMPMWSLTLEKVEDLRGEMRQKELELEELRHTSVQTLWKRDLDALVAALDKQDGIDEMLLQEGRKFQKNARAGQALSQKQKQRKAAPQKGKQAAKKKKQTSSSEESISSESSEEDSDSGASGESDEEEESYTPPKKAKTTVSLPTGRPASGSATSCTNTPASTDRRSAPAGSSSLFQGTSSKNLDGAKKGDAETTPNVSVAAKKDEKANAESSGDRPEIPPPAPAIARPLSLLERLKMGATGSALSSSYSQKKQMTLEEIFGSKIANKSVEKKSDAEKDEKSREDAGASEARTGAERRDASRAETSLFLLSDEESNSKKKPTSSSSSCSSSSVSASSSSRGESESRSRVSSQSGQRRRKPLVLSSDDESEEELETTSRKRKAHSSLESTPTTKAKKAVKQTTPKKKKASSDEEVVSLDRASIATDPSPCSTRPQRRAAAAPKKYKISDSEDDEEDESAESSIPSDDDDDDD